MSLLLWILVSVAALFLFGFIFLIWWWGFFFKPYYPHVKSRYATVDGVKLHYVCEGQGPDLLLMHGMAANIYCWRKLIPLLSQHFKVWAVDLRGYGLSDKPLNEPYDLKTQAKFMLKFIHQEIGEKCVLVGSSMGGAICLEAALSEPQTVSALGLLSPAYDSSIVVYDPRVFRKFLKLSIGLANPWMASRMMKYIYGPKTKYTRENILNYLRPYLKNTKSIYALVDSMACLTDKTLKDRIGEIKIPTVILWGVNDYVVSFSLSKYIQKTISHSQLFVHDSAGHHIQEEEPEWVSEKMTEFFLTSDKISAPSV